MSSNPGWGAKIPYASGPRKDFRYWLGGRVSGGRENIVPCGFADVQDSIYKNNNINNHLLNVCKEQYPVPIDLHQVISVYIQLWASLTHPVHMSSQRYIRVISLHWVFPPCSHFLFFLFQFSSVAQSCPTLWDPMGCNTPGFPVLHYLPEFAQTHVHWVGDVIQPLILGHPLLLLPSIFSSPVHAMGKKKKTIGRGHLFPKHLWSSLRIHWWSKNVFAASMSSKGYIY